MPMISVIIPVYNAEKYLRESVESVLSQSYQDFEIILVDDGSPDRCGAICDVYADKDSRIRVIHQNNQGQASARNNAIKIAKGEWVCFVDSDDLIHPDMLKSLLDAAAETGADISACDFLEAENYTEAFFDVKIEKYETIIMGESTLIRLYSGNSRTYWCVCAKLIRKEIVENLPFTEGRFFEDNAVMCQWLMEAKSICVTNTQFYFYRENNTGTTKSAYSLKRLDYLWALQEQMAFYRANKLFNMESIIAHRYLRDAKSNYYCVKNELKDSERAEQVFASMKDVYKRYRSTWDLEKWELEEWDSLFFPVKRLYHQTRHVGSKVIRKLGMH